MIFTRHAGAAIFAAAMRAAAARHLLDITLYYAAARCRYAMPWRRYATLLESPDAYLPSLLPLPSL